MRFVTNNSFIETNLFIIMFSPIPIQSIIEKARNQVTTYIMGCTSSKGTQQVTAPKVTTNNDTGNDDSSGATISSTLALGAGCYWGTEKFIVKNFQKKFANSIKDAQVGFMNPNSNAMKNPSYRQVCSGKTGHVEVLNVVLNDPTPELTEELIRFFFSFHDPTTRNSQGNDRGSQYASIIFCTDQQQTEIAKKVKAELQELIEQRKIKAFAKNTVTTGIVEYTDFYKALKEHQEYLSKHPLGYCNHRIRFKKWPEVK
jgi:peptide-methionine (S)-S-oxide reductase